MNLHSKVSLPVIRRLPRYYRHITELKNKGVIKVSSSELAAIMGTTASQVRQDFNCFGGFGQQGIGYNVQFLHDEITNLLYSEKKLGAILIGTGRLGRLISSYLTGEAKGYNLLASFDKNKDEVGKTLSGVPVLDIEELTEFCKETKPDIAALCLPKSGAIQLAPTLVSLGIKGFWNFSHYDLSVEYEGVIVENVHLSDSLASLAYRVRNEGE